MAQVAENEVVPGLVVRLDTALLRQAGGCLTNAEVAPDGDRAVQGPHYFLVLEPPDGDGRFLAVPLFSKPAPGSQQLDEQKKGGHPNDWIGITSYYSKWQHWWIPTSAVPGASANDQSPTASRRTYATAEADVLAAIAGWRHQNRCGVRAL